MARAHRLAIFLYLTLLALCVCLIVISDQLGPSTAATLLPVATDGFKTVLGALVGALSAILGVKSASA